MKSDIKIIQEIELEMLEIFHNICIENDLTYYAVGGTLLGAIRHDGFIPWDDDIDLAMPRDDYEKFIDSFYLQLPQNLKLIKNSANLDILQLVNINTKIKVGKLESGIFLDIFPIDGTPNNRLLRKIYSLNILFHRMLCKIAVLDNLEDKDRGLIENVIVNISKAISLNKILVSAKQIKKLHKLISKYTYEKSEFVGNILGRYREREIVDKKIFGRPVSKKFSGISILTPEKSELYLSKIYGDFMKLPPKEQQIAHNIEILSINLGKDFIK